MGELPPGQLSCVGIMQVDLQSFLGGQSTVPTSASINLSSPITLLRELFKTLLYEHAPARPDILLLPELILPGPVGMSELNAKMVDHIQSSAIEIPGPEIEDLTRLANEYQISLVLGIAEKAAFGNEKDLSKIESSYSTYRYYNTVLLIDPEGVYGKYRKIHLTLSDRLWASPGNLGLPTFDTPAGRIGLATGYDVLFPETVRVLAGKGADLVCVPTLLNFPDPIGLRPS